MATESEADTEFVPSEHTAVGGRDLCGLMIYFQFVFGTSVHEEKKERESKEEEEEGGDRGAAVCLVAEEGRREGLRS